MVINGIDVSDDSKIEQLKYDLADCMGYDSKKQEIEIYNNISTDENKNAQVAATGIQLMQALLVGRNVDAIFCNYDYFERFTDNDCLMDLRDCMDEKFLQKYKKDLIYYDSQSLGKRIVAGIRIPVQEQSKWMLNNQWYVSDCVVSVAVNSKNTELAKKVVMLALGE